MTEWVTIASVVEGHGDVAALPLLIRRVAIECYGCYDVLVPNLIACLEPKWLGAISFNEP